MNPCYRRDRSSRTIPVTHERSLLTAQGYTVGNEKRFKDSVFHEKRTTSLGFYDLGKTSLAYEAHYSLRGSSLCDTSQRSNIVMNSTDNMVGPGSYSVDHVVIKNTNSRAPLQRSYKELKRKINESKENKKSAIIEWNHLEAIGSQYNKQRNRHTATPTEGSILGTEYSVHYNAEVKNIQHSISLPILSLPRFIVGHKM